MVNDYNVIAMWQHYGNEKSDSPYFMDNTDVWDTTS